MNFLKGFCSSTPCQGGPKLLYPGVPDLSRAATEETSKVSPAPIQRAQGGNIPFRGTPHLDLMLVVKLEVQDPFHWIRVEILSKR